MLLIASLSPNPAIISAVHPPTPIIVIINLFLYLNIFLAVTFLVKFNLFHINVIRSNKTRFPGFGAFGLINVAGFCFNVL